MMDEQTMTFWKEPLSFAVEKRLEFIGPEHQGARRLFNGFYEGAPAFLADLYGRTLVLYDNRKGVDQMDDLLDRVQTTLIDMLPWIDCAIQKRRYVKDRNHQRGILTFGEEPAEKVVEHGVWYAVDLTMNQDASFYLDTRELRRWLFDHAAGWQVLNTFAYTGSLGVAALAGGAESVFQSDRNNRFLNLGQKSAMLNHLDLGKMKSRAADFFSQVAYFKRTGALFDCVILDPPVFSATQKGTIHLNTESQRLVNKVRPLVRDGGTLVAINNAIFLSGREYLTGLEELCQDGYLSIDTLIPVPEDVTGFSDTIQGAPPADPAPFNHGTKIAVLRVRRK